ncbi:MAG: twin transmembrane helix small protein [Albidovulum sp.]|nr:twin transmembrane helix small protein [Albidovulum sp.]
MNEKLESLVDNPMFFVVIIAVLAVLVILMVGIGGFARGGEFNRKYANKIMRLRIIAQAVAVALILVFVIFSQAGD